MHYKCYYWSKFAISRPSIACILPADLASWLSCPWLASYSLGLVLGDTSEAFGTKRAWGTRGYHAFTPSGRKSIFTTKLLPGKYLFRANLQTGESVTHLICCS